MSSQSVIESIEYYCKVCNVSRTRMSGKGGLRYRWHYQAGKVVRRGFVCPECGNFVEKTVARTLF